MMTRKTMIMCVLTILLVVYTCVALHVTGRMASEDHLTDMRINIAQTASRSFVTPGDIYMAIGVERDTISRVRRDTFDLYALQKRLRESDRIQDVRVSMLANGILTVDVVPMVPVARVFDDRRKRLRSYYINVEGKRIVADPHHHIDVPVVTGSFDSIHPARRLLPLLDFISADSRLSSLISTVYQEPDGNLILIPVIVGHVINFGDTSMVADKFARLRSFYRRVAPVRGWEMYDTIAVKWRGRIVGRQRSGALAPVTLAFDDVEADFPKDFDIDPSLELEFVPDSVYKKL